MIQELAARNIIKAALDDIVIDRVTDATEWAALTVTERLQSIVSSEYWRPDLTNEGVISRANISDSVHAFLEWGDIDSYTDAHPAPQHLKANYTFNINLFTANCSDPQGALMTAEETVFDKMKTIVNVSYEPTGGRWATSADRSVSILVIPFKYANQKLNT